MVDNIKAAFAKRIEAHRLDGARDQGGSAEEGRDHGRRRRLSRHLARLFRPRDRADDAYGNLRTRAQLANTSTSSRRSASRWTAANGGCRRRLVNAVNLPLQNALNFPAAILVKPFFDPAADPAFNYGAIGAVIGHEISHSFDNLGALFDASGTLRNWWTPADFAQFKAAGDALAAQYRRL